MKKWAQATIFIIIALVIFAIIIVLFIFNRSSANIKYDYEYFLTPEIKPQMEVLNSYIFDCQKQVATDAIDKIGAQGGYYDAPVNIKDFSWGFIPYYFYKGKLYNPEKPLVEKEIAKYVNNKLISCIDKNNNDFFDVRCTNIDTTVAIENKNINFITNMPIIITKDKASMKLELKNHQINIDSKLGDILEVTKLIAKETLENPGYLCMGCLVEILEEKNLNINMFDFDNNSVLITIIEEKDEPYIFQFLNNYDGIKEPAFDMPDEAPSENLSIGGAT